MFPGFLDECHDMLRKLERDKWESDLQLYPKLRTYKVFKSTFGTEPYLLSMLSPNLRSLLAQLRCGILPLRIETGRFCSPYLPADRRICQICYKEPEDEMHFLFKCPHYNNERFTWFNSISEHIDIDHNCNIDKLKLIFKNKICIKATALYVKDCMAKRSSYLTKQ